MCVNGALLLSPSASSLWAKRESSPVLKSGVSSKLLDSVDGEHFLAFGIDFVNGFSVDEDKVTGFLAVFFVTLAACHVAILVLLVEGYLAFPLAFVLAVHPGAAHACCIGGDDGCAGGLVRIGVVPGGGLAGVERDDFIFCQLLC